MIAVLALLGIWAVLGLLAAWLDSRPPRRRPRHLAPPPPGMFATAFPPRTPRHRQEP